MDRRKLIDNKTLKLNDVLKSEDLNLEIASNIENLINIRELIKMKARDTYASELEKKRSFTAFTFQNNLEDIPRWHFVVGTIIWWLAYRGRMTSKQSVLYVWTGISLFNYWRRGVFCKMQNEYEQFEKLDKNLSQIFIMKKKSYSLEQKLKLFFGFDFKKNYPIELLITKYEQIF